MFSASSPLGKVVVGAIQPSGSVEWINALAEGALTSCASSTSLGCPQSANSCAARHAHGISLAPWRISRCSARSLSVVTYVLRGHMHTLPHCSIALLTSG